MWIISCSVVSHCHILQNIIQLRIYFLLPKAFNRAIIVMIISHHSAIINGLVSPSFPASPAPPVLSFSHPDHIGGVIKVLCFFMI